MENMISLAFIDGAGIGIRKDNPLLAEQVGRWFLNEIDELPDPPPTCSVIFFSFRGSSGEMEHHSIQASDAASLLSRTMGELEDLKRWIGQMPNSPQNTSI